MTNIISMAWFLYLGFTPVSSMSQNDIVMKTDNNFVQTMGADFYVMDFFHVYTTIDIRDTINTITSFLVYRADFEIGADINYRDFSLGIKHRCDHDVTTLNRPHEYNGMGWAFSNVYFSYKYPLSITQDIKITPKAAFTYQFDEVMGTADKTRERTFEFFGTDHDNSFQPRFGVDVDLWDISHSWFVYQVGYSTSNWFWTHHQFEMGTEVSYKKHTAIGVNYITRINVHPTRQPKQPQGFSINEFQIYIKFSGDTYLF